MARKSGSSKSDKAQDTPKPGDDAVARPEDVARPEEPEETATSRGDTDEAASRTVGTAPDASDAGPEADPDTPTDTDSDLGRHAEDAEPPADDSPADTTLSDDPEDGALTAEGLEETPTEQTADAETPEDQTATADTPGEARSGAFADTTDPAPRSPEDAAVSVPAAPAPAPARGPGFLTLLAGGIVAAVIGFGAARFVIPEGWPFGPVSQATRELTQALDAQAERLESLRADLDALPENLSGRIEQTATDAANAAIAALRDDMGARIDALSADLTSMQDSLSRLDDFNARLTELERRPVADGTASRAAIESFERELAGLRDLLEQERARNKAAEAEIEERAQAMRDEAADLARQSARDAAQEQITQALTSGGGFAQALDRLSDAGITIPDALRQHAQTGVATLESLQDGFAEPARAALQATADTTTGEIGAFLRTQFGVRSLSPREGDSVDAILSRAEAAVRAGDLAGALSELETLPPEGRDAMADWIEAARARKDVVEAAASITQQ